MNHQSARAATTMTIRFKCPNCQKGLSVKDHLAGKKANCPACKQSLTIPAPLSEPANFEDLAASALADEPAAAAAAAAAQEAKTIFMRCAFCDEEVQFSAALAGKQAPCPECRRIIKVPRLVETKPTDWRRVEVHGPSGARREEHPGFEGAWGTEVAKRRVSHEALEEVGAIPEKKEPVPLSQKVRRGILAGVGLAVVVGAFFGIRTYFSKTLEQKAVARALEYVDPKTKLGPEATAELHRAAGEYFLLSGKLKEAREHLGKARNIIRGLPPSPEQDAMLIELALTQVELGGSSEQVLDQARIEWGAAQKDLRQSLELPPADPRAAAVRAVASRLNERNQPAVAAPLAKLYSATAEKKDPKAKGKPAGGADEGEDEKVTPPAKDTLTPVAAEELALWLFLEKEAEAKTIKPVPNDPKAVDPIARVGYAVGWARQGKWEEARRLALREGPPQERFQACLAVADVAFGLGPVSEDRIKEGRPCLDAAFGLVQDGKFVGTKTKLSPWDLYQLARLLTRAGMSEQAGQLTKTLPENLVGRTQLEVLRIRLESKKGQSDAEWDKSAAEGMAARALVVLAVARHKARYGSGSAVFEEAEALEPERVRPFGYLGVALGMRDGRR